jgi:hypothetical protein
VVANGNKIGRDVHFILETLHATCHEKGKIFSDVRFASQKRKVCFLEFGICFLEFGICFL